MGDLQLNPGELTVSTFFFQIDLSFCQVTIMNKLVVLATVCLIGANGEPDPEEYEREVTSLQNLQQQPAPSWNPYGGAQGFANPYMRNYGQQQPSYGQPQPSYGQPQPSYGQPQQPSGIGASATWGGYGQPQPQPSYPYSSYPQMPSYGGIGASATWGGYQVGGSAGYYPNSNYGQYNPVQSSTSKPNYNEPEYEDEDSEAEDKPEIGAVVVESGNSGQMNGGLNWNNGGGMNWNGGYNQNPPSWSQSYTPVGGGCYNRCKPKCSFRPPPPPPMPMPPRPRPRPIPMPAPRPQPMPLPQPARPNYGCRTSCRPTCNTKPSCGGGAQMNGNTMMCNSQSRPNYNQGPPSYNQGYNQGYGGGMYGNYGNYNSMYGGMKATLPAADPRPKVKASKTVESEAVVANEEKVEVEDS